ncbi:MAG: hypothetical protein HC905_13765 [Bacteroidales bacterium]|nr:hypothetical protein [Bacteroidales bacterium]
MKSFDLLLNNFETLNRTPDPVNTDIFKAIIESSPNLMAIVQDGRFAFVNACGLKMMKCKTPEEIIGKEIKETVAHGYETAIPYLNDASHKSVHLK